MLQCHTVCIEIIFPLLRKRKTVLLYGIKTYFISTGSFSYKCSFFISLLFPFSIMMILLSSSHLPLYFSSPPPIFSLSLPLLPTLLSVPPFLSREVLSSRQALNNPLSFIHDVLITNSVINTLPNQCSSSIMPDQSGLMLRRKLDRLLGIDSNMANVREFNRERESGEHWAVPPFFRGWRSSCHYLSLSPLNCHLSIVHDQKCITCARKTNANIERSSRQRQRSNIFQN